MFFQTFENHSRTVFYSHSFWEIRSHHIFPSQRADVTVAMTVSPAFPKVTNTSHKTSRPDIFSHNSRLWSFTWNFVYIFPFQSGEFVPLHILMGVNKHKRWFFCVFGVKGKMNSGREDGRRIRMNIFTSKVLHLRFFRVGLSGKVFRLSAGEKSPKNLINHFQTVPIHKLFIFNMSFR